MAETVAHSFELPDGRVIEGASTLGAQRMRLAQFPIPADLTGKRVLDVGTWDGWFAIEMARRGAEVVAIDRFENPRFYEARDLTGARVDYRIMSVYDLDPNRLGRFDIVLFLGVLYHLKHPLLGLERACAMATDMVAIESFVLKDAGKTLEFFEDYEFGGQFDNWCAPTVPCLLALCRTAGFARVDLANVHQYGAAVTCRRLWDAGSPGAAAQLHWAAHAENYGINFDARSSDEYVACAFAAEDGEITRDTVEPQAGGYGVRPVLVGSAEGGWRAHFKLPPGLAPGWHEVRVRTRGSGWSNAVEIAVDVPFQAESLTVHGIADALSWAAGRVSLANGHLALWIGGLPRNADRNNVRVEIGGRAQLTTYVGPPNAAGVRQVNVKLHERTPGGIQPLFVRAGGAEAGPATLEVV
jgi:tRNA (mo5U34)-methyltransferase